MPFPSPFGELPAAPGGGALADPTLEVGVSFGAPDTDKAYLLKNNDAVNPAVVELAFTHSAIKAKTFDHGTAESPSFALDPNPSLSATRAITFERGAGAPVYPAGPITETITATLADGSTVTQDMTVHALETFMGLVTNFLGQPLIEYRMDADVGALLKDYGSLGYHAEKSHVGSFDPNISALYPGFTGYTQSFYTSACLITNNSSVQPSDVLSRDASRTVILALTPLTGGVPGVTTLFSTPLASTYSWGDLRRSGSVLRYNGFSGLSAWSLESTQAGTSHSISGPAEDTDISASGADKTILIAWSYDVSGLGTSTVRWKQKGHSAGHSLYTATPHTAVSDASTAPGRWLGYYSGYSPQNVRYNYYAIADGILSESEFDALCSTVGF